jgi:hypothetical protein
MSNDATRYTVLGFGEQYVAPAEKKGRMPGEPPVGRSVPNARALLAPKVAGILSSVAGMPAERRLGEVVVELRLDDKFLAKSYAPEDLLRNTGLALRGLGTWTQYSPTRSKKKGDASSTLAIEPRKSRSLFVSGTDASLGKLRSAIEQGLSADVDNDLTKLEDIRLPGPSDRLRMGLESMESGTQAIEVVLFDWDASLRNDAIARVLDLFSRCGVEDKKRRVKVYDDGPTFIAAIVPFSVIAQLGALNFLRSARPLGRVNLSKEVVRHAISPSLVPTQVAPPLARIAVFDGGFAKGHPLLDPYVDSFDLTTKPPVPSAVEHGTMVASAAVYGSFDGTGAVPAPACRVLSYRVLPDPEDDDLELYGAIDAIEAEVPRLPKDVAVVNLSFGPSGPIDDIPARFTYSIDRLGREASRLFVTAVGNDGNVVGCERIQSPADAVNNLGVGAFRLNSAGKPEHASYSCRGPGRSGGFKKPDVLGFGGCDVRPFLALLPNVGELGATTGTSFAAPVVSCLAGRTAALVDQPVTLGPEALRALLIHSACPLVESPDTHAGHGVAAASVEAVLACSPTQVSVLYQGTVSPRDSWKLPFLLPTDFAPGGKLALRWTVVTSPDVNEAAPDEYTLAGLEIAFRPHSDVYGFTPPEGSSQKAVKFNIQTEAVRQRQLLAEGWKQSALPASDNKKGRGERELRASEGKWESVMRAQRGKNPNSISEPMLTISVLGRGSWDRRDTRLQARFAAILTVDAPKYDGDLYAEVIAAFDKLKPLTLRGQSRGTGRLRT